MSTDREWLELAAKAAGLPGEWCDCVDCGGVILTPNDFGARWNPLADDGDALRLAIDLGIGVRYEKNAPPELNLPRECAVAVTEDRRWFSEEAPDQYAAARRAIVRAAAEIGKHSAPSDSGREG